MQTRCVFFFLCDGYMVVVIGRSAPAGRQMRWTNLDASDGKVKKKQKECKMQVGKRPRGERPRRRNSKRHSRDEAGCRSRRSPIGDEVVGLADAVLNFAKCRNEAIASLLSNAS